MIYRLPPSWLPFRATNEPLPTAATAVVAEEDSFNPLVALPWLIPQPTIYGDDDGAKLANLPIDQENLAANYGLTTRIGTPPTPIYTDDELPITTATVVAEEDSFSVLPVANWINRVPKYTDDDGERLPPTLAEQEDSPPGIATAINIVLGAHPEDDVLSVITTNVVEIEDAPFRLVSPNVLIVPAGSPAEELPFALAGIIVAEEDVRSGPVTLSWILPNALVGDLQDDFPFIPPTPSAPIFFGYWQTNASFVGSWRANSSFSGPGWSIQ